MFQENNTQKKISYTAIGLAIGSTLDNRRLEDDS